ncbi:tyrosine-type recombinase/integrase [Paenibacillus phytohabitans]|uniref:tyrosine-type recombinase/integrase n=1 Tax=Paenibacillus phytohabitans TaxID=2654978 RepID=UPI00300A3444
MNAILSAVKHTENYDQQGLLNKRLSVKAVLKLFEANPTLNAHEFLELISPLFYKQKEDTTIFKRLIPLMSKNELYPQIILTFESYYLQRGYAVSTLEAHMRNLRGFLSFLSNTFEMDSFASLTDMRALTKNMVSAYEMHLIDRLNSEEIQLCSVYRYLVTLRLFLSMLAKESIVKISYAIPESLRGQAERSNDYVEMEQINALLDSIVMSKSPVKTRDMAVILLVMELGCRPIEVANLKIDDLNITERQITLYCIKSGLRRLRISKDLCNVISMYLKIRSSMIMNHDNLFANAFGEPLTRRAVGSIFERVNRNAFGENRFNAKALRHTYATNALDNENDFDEVSESMGHKHRCSTEWYVHRSVKRLLTRTLTHNPLKRIEGSEV